MAHVIVCSYCWISLHKGMEQYLTSTRPISYSLALLPKQFKTNPTASLCLNGPAYSFAANNYAIFLYKIHCSLAQLFLRQTIPCSNNPLHKAIYPCAVCEHFKFMTLTNYLSIGSNPFLFILSKPYLKFLC